MTPDWDGLGRLLQRRRRELGYANVEHLRQDARGLPPGKPSRGTLRNVEVGQPIDFETFLYLPALYRLSYDDLLGCLWPEHAVKHERAASLISSVPGLSEIVEQLASAPSPVRDFVAKGLGQHIEKEARARAV